MVLLLVVAEVIAGAVVLVAVTALLLVLRLRSLTRHRGTFDCALRRDGADQGGSWAFGVARTGTETLRWWRSRSFSPGPTWHARRCSLSVESRQPVTIEGEGTGMVVRLRSGTQTVELLMEDDAYTGFAAWLESAPPRDRGAIR